ncbi:MAG: glycine--tRNA ligase subunit beta, partial [Xanthomonadales bacterium]|nr:glycine--tRNA ligase subunit beta [Xanthomonadales bacterium]
MTDGTKIPSAADLLVELGCEELPPRALDTIREAFFRSVCEGLEKNHISFSRDGSRSYSTPRRIAIVLADVSPGQADQEQVRRGPSISAAFDDQSQPTGAALGFARSVGKEIAELETLKTEKGEWLYCRIRQAGKPLDEVVYTILEQSIKQLPVPKPMRWADHDFSFVRPVHWLIVLYGERIIKGSLFGLTAGSQTRGHRIHAPGPHAIASPEKYVSVLKKAFVLVDQEERKCRITEGLLQANENVMIDPALLNEVNNLVEWPVPVACSFEKEFLEVPHAALIASMQDHQKFFPVREANDSERVSNHFIAVANIESQDVKQVRQGFERVIRPRLADARFFLEQDKKETIDCKLAELDRVIFQQKIGSVGDKSRRISSISKKIAELMNFDPVLCARAALLAKCDLLTHMVGEFPELQGQMGRHYALFSGEDPEVAEAIGEHYAPKFAGDLVPASVCGRIVSIADRVDTLVGIFAAGLKPTGNKDPFALRRAALGLLRILLEANIDLPLRDVLRLAAKELSARVPIDQRLVDEVLDFVVDRLRHYYSDQGYRTELVNAALASPWTTLPDLDRRLRSISAFMGEEAAASLAASNKRIGNILRKSDFVGNNEIDEDLFIFEEEAVLFADVARIE